MKNETMKAKKQNKKVFLVLVPHRDVRSILQKYCDETVKAGLTGVYSFPCVAPIAELSEEFTGDELKIAARSLRAATGGEKMYIGEDTNVSFPIVEENMTLLGRNLDLNISPNIFGEEIKKVKKLFSPLIIGSWLIPKANEQQLGAENFAAKSAGNFAAKNASAPLREKLSFRAAATANMYWRPFQAGDEICYKWKIGKLTWLPNKAM